MSENFSGQQIQYVICFQLESFNLQFAFPISNLLHGTEPQQFGSYLLLDGLNKNALFLHSPSLRAIDITIA